MASYQNHVLSKNVSIMHPFFTWQQNISSKYNFLSTIFLFNTIFSLRYHHQLFMHFLSLLNPAFFIKNNPFITFKLEKSWFFIARVKFLHNNPIAHVFQLKHNLGKRRKTFLFWGHSLHFSMKSSMMQQLQHFRKISHSEQQKTEKLRPFYDFHFIYMILWIR